MMTPSIFWWILKAIGLVLANNCHKYCQFFMIFDENDILYVLVEFETDRMSPCESAENGRNGAHGLNCIIFVNSEVIFEIYDKNYPLKKFQVSRPVLNFLPLNHFRHFSIFGLLGFVGAI